MSARSGDLQFAPSSDMPRVLERPRRMRICHIASADLWAGAEVQIATTASYLVERPDVDLSAVLFNEGVLACKLRRLGIPVVVLDERRRNALQLVYDLAWFLKENDIEIVHTHRYKENVLGGLAAKLAGVPHVIRTVHGLTEPVAGWKELKFRAYETLDKATAWLFTDRIVAVSNEMLGLLENSGYRGSALVQIHNGVDLATLRPRRPRAEVRRDLGIDERTVLIGTTGRLSPVKAQECLLRAAKLILHEEPETRFVVVGDGPLREKLTALATDLGINRQCTFLGARADVFDLLAAMDIFVLPSLHEGIPMVLLEAMALERPVIATAVGGVPEVIAHRANGLLIQAGDEQGLADACLELMRDRDRAFRMAARGRQTIEERFTHDNGRELVQLYENVSRRRGTNEWRPGALRLSWLLVREPLEHAMRKLRDALAIARERQRMRRIRRHPETLAGALRSAKNILVVCQGNIIRSPFAACRIAQALAGNASVSITSAGLEAVPGRSPHPTAIETASSHRVDLSLHTARPVETESVAKSDLILAMETAQLVALRKRFPEARSKTFLLTCLSPDAPLEIRDPFDGDATVFQACYDHISRATDPIVHCLSR